MRDIIRSNKGRTKADRDYGYDAGDYVPALERRTVPARTFESTGRYGRFGRLANAQESHADEKRYEDCDNSEAWKYAHFVVRYGR